MNTDWERVEELVRDCVFDGNGPVDKEKIAELVSYIQGGCAKEMYQKGREDAVEYIRDIMTTYHDAEGGAYIEDLKEFEEYIDKARHAGKEKCGVVEADNIVGRKQCSEAKPCRFHD